MVTMSVMAILLTLNMLLLHGDKLVKFYYVLYKKIKKPKFVPNELVMIDNIEWKVILISESLPLYTYLCIRTAIPSKNACYFAENRIQKKTGVLKELE
jgi:hypothetical protein